MITVKINDKDVQDAVRKLSGRCENLRLAIQDIDEYMNVATKKRFVRSEAPDGSLLLHFERIKTRKRNERSLKQNLKELERKLDKNQRQT